RAAADALGQHATFEHIRPLLDARERVPTEDAQLLHTIRMSLRNQLLPEENLLRFANSLTAEKDSRAIADVAIGVKSAPAGTFLLHHVQKYSEDQEKLTGYLRHAARYAPESELAGLASFTRTRFANDIDFQLALFKAIQEGAKQRGSELNSS